MTIINVRMVSKIPRSASRQPSDRRLDAQIVFLNPKIQIFPSDYGFTLSLFGGRLVILLFVTAITANPRSPPDSSYSCYLLTIFPFAILNFTAFILASYSGEIPLVVSTLNCIYVFQHSLLSNAPLWYQEITKGCLLSYLAIKQFIFIHGLHFPLTARTTASETDPSDQYGLELHAFFDNYQISNRFKLESG